MKTKYQAWGCLAAGVLAAGLNANYFAGGFERAHRAADHVMESSGAVLALFSGQANQFLAEYELLAAPDQASSSPLATTMARVKSAVVDNAVVKSAVIKSAVVDQLASLPSPRSPRGTEIAKLMAARGGARFARLEAHRTRTNEEIAARTAQFRIMAADFAPLVLKTLPAAPATCSRVRVSVSEMPEVKMPTLKMPLAPALRFEAASADPI